MPRTSINFTPEEKEALIAAMRRDGMSQLTTWLKSIGLRYASGQLVPRGTVGDGPPASPETEALIKEISDFLRKNHKS